MVGSVAYKIELPQELSRVHNKFHVSNLKKYYADEPLAVPLDGLHIDDKIYFVEEPIEIMDQEVKRLKRSSIPIVKVRWNSRRGPEFTWEREDQFQKMRVVLLHKMERQLSVKLIHRAEREMDGLLGQVYDRNWLALPTVKPTKKMVVASRMELYMENRENGKMILDSVLNDPLVWPTVFQDDGTTRKKKYEEYLATKKIQADCDLKATNIVLQGLPRDVYAIFNHHKVAKEIWDRFKILMQGIKLSLQERKCKLYDEFDKFSLVKGETLY
uniref:Putative reverse transcriptase domain-containing protein n=1 Tax=Tanacetum cinerariifolium TaxID=118510 RepID=A0A6L2JEX6_TANCI|nr:putative reverse transcriptase domain-containing protein [Tanacetum cinerariifolium]